MKKFWDNFKWITGTLFSGLALELFHNTTFLSINNFFLTAIQITYYQLIIGLITVFLLFQLFLLIKKGIGLTHYNKAQRAIMKINNQYDNVHNASTKWKVYFDEFDNPIAKNFQVFCHKHGDRPLRLIPGQTLGIKLTCPFADCDTIISDVNYLRLINGIESTLIYKYDQMK